MRVRARWLIAVMLVGTVLSSTLASAAQPRELWNAYPLDQQATTPQATPAPGGVDGAVATPADTAAPSDRPFPWAALGGAIAGVAVLSSVLIAVGRRWRRGTQAAALSVEPEETDPESDDDPAFAAYVASLVGPVSPSDLLAPPARPRPRPQPSRPTAEELELAHIAEQYLAIVAAGSTRPVLDLAARRDWSLGMTKKKLSRARAQGILTRPGRGRTGGELTERGGRILTASERRRAAEPRHLRLAPPLTDAPAQPFRRRASDLAADPAPKMARDQGGSG